jgi:predicted PurR-regulated permease PerM
MSRFVSFLVLVAILVLISIIFFQVMAGFLVPLFLAALLGVIVQPLYRWTLTQCRGYRHVAAGVSTFLVAVIVLLPIGLVIMTATLEGISLVDRLQLGDVRQRLDKLRDDFGLKIPRDQDVRHLETVLQSWREKQRTGERLEITESSVDNLLQRTANLQTWIE